MQILHAHPSQVTLFNLVKVPHVFSHHANSKLSAHRCNHTLQTTTDHQFDQTIRLLLNQDKTITMIPDLKHTKLVLFYNRTAAQDHPSDQFHSTMYAKDALQTITMLLDNIPAHPLQQVLYATTVED
jgi:hypothetical protein